MFGKPLGGTVSRWGIEVHPENNRLIPKNPVKNKIFEFDFTMFTSLLSKVFFGFPYPNQSTRSAETAERGTPIFIKSVNRCRYFRKKVKIRLYGEIF